MILLKRRGEKREKENENKIEQDLSLHVQVNEEDCKVEDANIETLLKEAEAKKEQLQQHAQYYIQDVPHELPEDDITNDSEKLDELLCQIEKEKLQAFQILI